MRRRAVHLVTLFLAAATGVGLLGVAAIVADTPVGSGREVANIALARSYYAAIADVLQTGDPAALDVLVSSDFVDHHPAIASGSSRDDFRRYLIGLRATLPDLSLTVVDLLADGNHVTARFTVTGTPRPDFVGIPLSAEALTWDSLEVLRIRDGKVVERWGSSDAMSLYQPLLVATFDRLPAAPLVAALARITYAPGADFRAPRLPALPGPGLLLVETGTVTIIGHDLTRLIRSAGSPSQTEVLGTGRESVLVPGEIAVFPTAASSLRNDGPVPVVVLALAFFPRVQIVLPPPGMPLAPPAPAIPPGNDGWRLGEALMGAMFSPTEAAVVDLPPGIQVERLAGGVLGENPTGPIDVAVGLATLVPGGRLPAHKAPGPELVAVDAGTLAVAVDGAGQVLHGGANPNSEIETELGPGDGVFLPQGEYDAFGNAGTTPVSFILVRLTSLSP